MVVSQSNLMRASAVVSGTGKNLVPGMKIPTGKFIKRYWIIIKRKIILCLKPKKEWVRMLKYF